MKENGTCSEWKAWHPLESFNLVLPSCYKRLCTFVRHNNLEIIMKRCESLLLSKIRAEKEICNLENWSAVSKAPCDPLFSPFFVYFLWLAQVGKACCTLHTRRCPYFVQKPFHHRKSCNFVQHSWCARDQNWQYFAKLCPKIQKNRFLYFSWFHCQKAIGHNNMIHSSLPPNTNESKAGWKSDWRAYPRCNLF